MAEEKNENGNEKKIKFKPSKINRTGLCKSYSLLDVNTYTDPGNTIAGYINKDLALKENNGLVLKNVGISIIQTTSSSGSICYFAMAVFEDGNSGGGSNPQPQAYEGTFEIKPKKVKQNKS